MVNENEKELRDGSADGQWVKERDRAKTLWVVAVLAFWVSAIVMGVVYYLENRLDLILASVVLGLMVLGLWLKTRYQLIARKQPLDSKELVNGQDNQPGA